VFANRVYHCSSAFFRVSRLIDFETQLSAILHSGYLVSCRNFLTAILYLSNDLIQVGRCLSLKLLSYRVHRLHAIRWNPD
jgi:hypothetical protein